MEAFAALIAMAEHNDEIVECAKPGGTGCVGCLESGGWWLHLRRCAACGHIPIGCCDSSPNQHARKHFRHRKHAVIASFDPGEAWFYDFRTEGDPRRSGAVGAVALASAEPARAWPCGARSK